MSRHPAHPGGVGMGLKFVGAGSAFHSRRNRRRRCGAALSPPPEAPSPRLRKWRWNPIRPRASFPATHRTPIGGAPHPETNPAPAPPWYPNHPGGGGWPAANRISPGSRFVKAQPGSRTKLLHSAENAMFRGPGPAPSPTLSEALLIHLRTNRRMGQQRLQFGAEKETLSPAGKKQGLHPDPIPGREQGGGGIIPDGEGENPVEMPETFRSPILHRRPISTPCRNGRSARVPAFPIPCAVPVC